MIILKLQNKTFYLFWQAIPNFCLRQIFIRKGFRLITHYMAMTNLTLINAIYCTGHNVAR
jgi:hypothetical protein